MYKMRISLGNSKSYVKWVSMTMTKKNFLTTFVPTNKQHWIELSVCCIKCKNNPLGNKYNPRRINYNSNISKTNSIGIKYKSWWRKYKSLYTKYSTHLIEHNAVYLVGTNVVIPMSKHVHNVLDSTTLNFQERSQEFNNIWRIQ